MRKSTKADITVLFVTLFWGAGFPITKIALQTIPPMYHIGFRFLIASVLLGILFYKSFKNLTLRLVKAAFVLSVFLFACFALQTTGLMYTTASKSGFFSGLSVLIVPIFSIFYLKSKLKINTIFGIVLATVGLYLLSFSGGESTFNFGDFITVISTCCYGWQLLFTGTYVREHDTTLLAILELFFVSVFGFIFAFIFESFPIGISTIGFSSLMFSAILCTAFAFWVQTTVQKYTPASHLALLFTMEPVFGALTSYIFLHEILGIKGILGGVLIVFAMIVSELDILGFRESKSNSF